MRTHYSDLLLAGVEWTNSPCCSLLDPPLCLHHGHASPRLAQDLTVHGKGTSAVHRMAVRPRNSWLGSENSLLNRRQILRTALQSETSCQILLPSPSPSQAADLLQMLRLSPPPSGHALLYLSQAFSSTNLLHVSVHLGDFPREPIWCREFTWNSPHWVLTLTPPKPFLVYNLIWSKELFVRCPWDLSWAKKSFLFKLIIILYKIICGHTQLLSINCVVYSSIQQILSHFYEPNDKDSSLNQMWVRLLNFLLDSSEHFLVKSSLSKHPAFSQFNQNIPPSTPEHGPSPWPVFSKNIGRLV